MSEKMEFEAKKVTGKQCPEFQVSFESVHKPKAYKDGEPKFGMTMLFSKKTDLSEFKRATDNATIERWGENRAKWPKNLRSPFRDGDKESDQPGYAGKIFIRASSTKKPRLIDQRLEPIPSDEIGRETFYSGCFGKATLVAFAYENSGNRGVAFALLGVQKTRDGERFGGQRPVSEEFEEIEDSSEDESSYSLESMGA